MGEVFAGFVVGYMLALISALPLALLLLRLRQAGSVLGQILPATVPLAGFVLVVHGALFFFWTAIGILLGLILLAMDDAGSGLGSANLAFTIFIIGGTLALLAPVWVLLVPLRRYVTIAVLLIVGLFGWLMPHMAEWSRFGSS
jgi:hypothetical protein